MEKLENQALTRFERLWKIEGDKLLRANIIPSAVKDGEIYPRRLLYICHCPADSAATWC